MQVHRSAHARNFIVLPNAAAQDRRLSLAARGLLADLLSRPERWREDARQIADSSIDSRAAVRKALKELIAAGYYRVEKVRMPDGTIRSEAHVYDTPQLPGLKAAEKLLGTAKPQVTPRVARPASGVPDSGAAGVLVVKNLVKEPSLPAPDRGDVDGRRRTAPSVRHPRPAEGRVASSMDELVGPPRAAALALYRVLKDQPRLRLGDAEVVELAPLAGRGVRSGGPGCSVAARPSFGDLLADRRDPGPPRAQAAARAVADAVDLRRSAARMRGVQGSGEHAWAVRAVLGTLGPGTSCLWLRRAVHGCWSSEGTGRERGRGSGVSGRRRSEDLSGLMPIQMAGVAHESTQPLEQRP
ncbi:hypothetical protein, partial [Kitasatospora sp. NPDC057015]|uniref:hypothetical protein n=1 Tax=Kitasatospora sp. NPDC057015 TaxID=3346001 RepID=UPI00363ECFE9